MTIIPENLMIHSPKDELIELMEKNELSENILAEIPSDFHKIFVVENEIGRFLKYDETYQAGYISHKDYQGNLPYINYFFIPYLMNKDIENILLVGFGSGIMVGQYEKIFEKLKNIDVVDIEENIFEIAKDYFNFQSSEKINFNLQDAIIYLKTTKKKYDLIVVDVAGDEGIDERFCDFEYLNLINSHLTKKGIFVSNMPSSRDIFNKKNKFALNLIKDYKKNFKYVDVYSGETSNKIFYKTFFNMDEIVLDITNLILISSNEKYEISSSFEKLDEIKIKINDYLRDIISFNF